jgi:tetratricopeptide (TPR) repeat protein
MSLCSCERRETVSEIHGDTGSASSLSAAQLALAKAHLANNEPGRAIPYLLAARQAPGSGDIEELFTETIESAGFSIPTQLLRHPYPVIRFTENPGKAIFAALGGKHPTVIRWDLSETPEVTAVLFPTNASDISHISLSPDGLHLLVHRDGTNLLCDATTLKPVMNLGSFPGNLDPGSCQPFSVNGLLVAHPTKTETGNLIWQIRDTATGETLRTESTQLYPKPIHASFDGTTLCIALEDDREIRIPIQGESETIIKKHRPRGNSTRKPGTMLTDGSTIAISLPIPTSSGKNIPTGIIPAIAGYELDTATQTLLEIPIPNRLATLSEAFPGKIPPTLSLHSAETVLSERLAAAFPWEFPELAALQISHAEIIRQVFKTGDPEAIAAVVDSAGEGLPLSTALFLSMEMGDATLIEQILAKAKNMPPALRSLAKTGIYQITDPTKLRLEQDWIGYESPDFTPLFQESLANKSKVFLELSLPENPRTEDIEAFAAKLLDPENEVTLGKATLAERAISAAGFLAKNPENAAQALQIIAIAGRLGAQRASCLRVNASALTTLSDFKAAHRTWIDLITNQPEADHLSSDYSEAAYTAFGNGDPRQAMEILNTGLFRFPQDVSFAIRAGWISLLTGHPKEALVCLTRATKLGLPPAEIENTTALLAITHSQLDDPATASSYLEQLKAISPKWEDPKNIEALPWPESFKLTLVGIISEQVENLPGPSPENDPTDTAPPSGEFLIPEPPLPSR